MTLEALRSELAPMRADIAALQRDVAGMQRDLAGMRPNIDGIPLIQRAIATIHQEQRMMKAAINEIARTQFTSGEVEALHSDVNSVQSTHMEVETRLLSLERQMREVLEKLNSR
ncbi:MAG TPA: hypothetical protein VH684_14750 [Xanthobacteraceae bacterium]